MLQAQTTFANRVGTAPGTSTMYMPYSTMADLRAANGRSNGRSGFRGALGVISEKFPWMTGRTTTPPGLPGTATVVLNKQGGAAGLMGGGLGLVNPEAIRTLSGGFGIAPTDEELGRMYGYTPVQAGWITTSNGTVSALMGAGGGLGLDLFQDQEKLLRRQVALQTVSAVAFATLAGLSLVKFIRDWRRGF